MTMPEELERARQAIMRYRELLDILRLRLEEGEQRYSRLFAHLSPEETAGKPEKERQRLAAYDVLRDSTALERAVLQSQFDARDLEREFEHLHHIIVELRG